MNQLPREIITRILDYCPPADYVNFIETGLATAFPVDASQHQNKKHQYAANIRAKRINSLVSTMRSGKAPEGSSRGAQLAARLFANDNENLQELTSTLAGLIIDTVGSEPNLSAERVLSGITPDVLKKIMCPEIIRFVMQIDTDLMNEMMDERTYLQALQFNNEELRRAVDEQIGNLLERDPNLLDGFRPPDPVEYVIVDPVEYVIVWDNEENNEEQ